MTANVLSTGIQYPITTRYGNTRTSGKWATRAIYGNGGQYGMQYNLINNYGGVSTDIIGAGTIRSYLAAAGYGGDKVIFAYGLGSGPSNTNISTLISNLGTVTGDVTGVGTARYGLAAAGYGVDKAIFGYGNTGGGGVVPVNMTNLVSNTGVVGSDVTGVGTARNSPAAAVYGVDKAIFGYGYTVPSGSTVPQNMTNLVSNTGVVGSDVTGVGTARFGLAAAGYGGNKAIFGYGNDGIGFFGTTLSMTNLVSNTGVVTGDVTGVGTARYNISAAGYGGDKAIFGYGIYGTFAFTNVTNLVSNTGVVTGDVTGVGTATHGGAAASYSS